MSNKLLLLLNKPSSGWMSASRKQPFKAFPYLLELCGHSKPSPDLSPKSRVCYFHLIRHGQAEHDDMHNNLTEEERLSLEDPKLTKLGIEQAANLGKSFSRLPFITTVFCSPSHRCIQTALNVIDPVGKQNPPINVSPFFREFSQYNCDQPLPLSLLQGKFKEDCIEWTLLESQQDFWKSDAHGGAKITLEEQAELCRKLIYETGQMFIKEGALNAEGNVEIVVVGHVVSLNCLMGNTAYSSRKFRPWDHTEVRSFAYIPMHWFRGLNIKAYDAYEEITDNRKAHLTPFIPRPPKALKPRGGGLGKGAYGPELPFCIWPSAPTSDKRTKHKGRLIKSSVGHVLITSAESADTLGVGHGKGREGSNVVFAFDQLAFPVNDRPADKRCHFCGA
ncbi:hypothetical protein N431DRAFT_538984 [Stipitochalara longipes BDJ]|nr:hypothetical protein N431DRAFT_538984 [Stipitochalara longipes BDJ]